MSKNSFLQESHQTTLRIESKRTLSHYLLWGLLFSDIFNFSLNYQNSSNRTTKFPYLFWNKIFFASSIRRRTYYNSDRGIFFSHCKALFQHFFQLPIVVNSHMYNNATLERHSALLNNSFLQTNHNGNISQCLWSIHCVTEVAIQAAPAMKISSRHALLFFEDSLALLPLRTKPDSNRLLR